MIEGVRLAGELSALQVLHIVLADAVAAFPNELRPVGMPENLGTFRNRYPDILPLFEASRVAASTRYEIARHLATALQEYVVLQRGDASVLLREALAEPVDPLPLELHSFSGEPGWRPEVVYRGERWETARLAELGGILVDRGMITQQAGDGLAWVTQTVGNDGAIDLSGRKVAVLGAGAEMAPTRLWLEAGADVLWLDTRAPPGEWWETQAVSGRLFWPAANVDLLADPQRVLATLIAFAEGAPLDLALYAYAPGQARELRLTVCMNAIVDALPDNLLRSVTMLVSPTTPAALSTQDVAAMDERVAARPTWEAALHRLGLLGRGGGRATAGNASVSRSVVATQGASYQAAQYLGKVMTAESWAVYGRLGSGEPQPLRVSANTAAITRTRSLAHPVFTAAFGGAAAFGIETFTPRQSRRLNGLLAVCDWMHPDLPTPGAVRVHGGIHRLGYPLGSALRVAAAIGFARSPRLLGGLLR
jgi:hypothetical protein